MPLRQLPALVLAVVARGCPQARVCLLEEVPAVSSRWGRVALPDREIHLLVAMPDNL